MQQQIQDILKQYWGYSHFRPLQQDIILSVLNGNDTVALLPTGGGKSICFQVPGLYLQGLTLVISPLIALMKDQVANLKQRQIKACVLFSGMGRKQLITELNNCLNGKYKFLYISPERLVNKDFAGYLKNMDISLIAVDEAHCISQWGYDFRPEYLRIGEIRETIKAPVLALTASATALVVNDICEKLLFRQNKAVYQKSFFRENLSYLVIDESNKLNRIKQIAAKVKGSGLVYVRNRKLTAEIAHFLNKNGIKAGFYHAGLSMKDRTQKQLDWMNGTTPVMVCTNAFGMGIDKPDVRFVIHYEIPDSPESYYQEAGRAGRDGKEAYCIILYDKNDGIDVLNRMLQQFPSKEYIEQVYQALGNYYQLAVNSGQGLELEFDLQDFCSSYSLKPVAVFAAIEFMHKHGLVALNEGAEKPSRLKISVNQIQLYDFQLKNTNLDIFLKTILRSYGGALFDNYLVISEEEIARRLNSTARHVSEQLQKLKKVNLLDYEPRSEKPQLTFLQPRLTETGISKFELEETKEKAMDRLKAMVAYCEVSNLCRSIQLLSYFDENNANPCGKCDICRKLKNLEMSSEKFYKLAAMLKSELLITPASAEAILQKCGIGHEKHMLQVIRWHLDEGFIEYDNTQKLKWLAKQ